MHLEQTNFPERLQNRPKPIMFMDVKKKSELHRYQDKSHLKF